MMPTCTRALVALTDVPRDGLVVQGVDREVAHRPRHPGRDRERGPDVDVESAAEGGARAASREVVLSNAVSDCFRLDTPRQSGLHERHDDVRSRKEMRAHADVEMPEGEAAALDIRDIRAAQSCRRAPKSA